MVKGTLENGFEFEITDEALNDYELIEVFNDIKDGDTGTITKAARLLLGEEQIKSLKAHVKGDSARVPADKMIAAITEILNYSKIKN